jgi:tRNA nucleotidyltransferase (CCA-adding enzyme)
MKTYLVGGAIRDRLLGFPIKERDYVIIDATIEQILKQGFVQVGKDFPVFLHPITRAEHALANNLYTDLQRRDLTINAMAEDEHGQIIDYFGGQQDLEQRILRHTSPAFADDPVRILRIARFMARYSDLNFQIAPETLVLIKQMLATDVWEQIASERIWREIDKSLIEKHPALFFETLRTCGVLAKILPELACLWGIPQPSRWHPEIDTGVHTMLVLQMARRLSDDPSVIFAALTHDLGKGETPPVMWPSHHGHEERGVRLIENVCRRLRPPTRYCELARLVARYHGNIHRAATLRARSVLCVLEETDAFRRPQRLENLLLACEADYRGRTGFAETAYPQRQWFQIWQQAAAMVDSGKIAATCSKPALIVAAITKARLHAIKNCRIEM